MIKRAYIIDLPGGSFLWLKSFTDECGHAKTYKAIRSPRCGCLACIDKYVQKCRDKNMRVSEVPIHD